MEARWDVISCPGVDFTWESITEETVKDRSSFNWQQVYDDYFRSEFLMPMMNLGLEYPGSFSGDYGRDLAQMFQAVRDAEYADPHRIPDGVVCPEKTGWYRVTVAVDRGRTSVGAYVLFVGLDTQTFHDFSPPYVLRPGDREKITLDKVRQWGERLPDP